MSPATIQFLVAGALVVAWTWMLGRPLLARWVERPHREWSGRAHSPARPTPHAGQGVAGTGDALHNRWSGPAFHPIAQWRAQPLGKRRLQTMLGFAFATFASALLAIALRGSFVRLFLLTAACFGLHLVVAAYVGSRQLRAIEAGRHRRSATVAAGPAAQEESIGTVADDEIDLLSGNGLGGGLFDEGFFEPIPELGPQTVDGIPVTPERSIFDPPPTTPAPTFDRPEEGPGEQIAAAVDGGFDDDRDEPTFTAPPANRPRPPRRDKGRPLYIEPPAEDGDDSVRAVND